MLRPPRDHRGNNHAWPHGFHGSAGRWRRITSIVISLGVGLVFSFVLGLVGAGPVYAQGQGGSAEPVGAGKAESRPRRDRDGGDRGRN